MTLFVGCSATPDPPSAAAVERAALRQAELHVLLAEAEQAAAGGEPLRAARIVVIERDTWPEEFGRVEASLRALGDPEVDAILGAAGAPEVAVARAFGPGLPATRARAAGATLGQARVVWHGIRAGFVDEVDEGRAADAVRARLALLGVDSGFRREFGERRIPEGADVVGLVESAVAGGWPEDVTVVAALDAAVETLDPWTRPVWPAERPRWEGHHAGVVTGPGLELAPDPAGGVVVALPLPGGPAWSAGVHAADHLVSVDGRDVVTVDAAEAALLGPDGTTVQLALLRAGRPLSVEVLRAPVAEETVRGWRRDGDAWEVFAAEGVAWVRVSAFRPTTDEAFDALTEFAAPDVVVLDLRGNGGGDLAAALHVADRFVADGPLVELEGRGHRAPEPGPNGELPWNVAAPGHALEGTPAVVLVDPRTASAAEILAAVLERRAGAVVIGEPTFGKLRSQSLRDDPASGAAWQVTTGRWRVGEVAERVVPALQLPLTPAERRVVDELVLRRELPPTHPDGAPVHYAGEVARRDLPLLEVDPVAAWALRLGAALR